MKKYKVTMELWFDEKIWDIKFIKKCNLVQEKGIISKKQKFEMIES